MYTRTPVEQANYLRADFDFWGLPPYWYVLFGVVVVGAAVLGFVLLRYGRRDKQAAGTIDNLTRHSRWEILFPVAVATALVCLLFVFRNVEPISAREDLHIIDYRAEGWGQAAVEGLVVLEPPLYFVFLKAISYFTTDPLIWRLFNGLAFGLGIIVIFRIGRIFFSFWAAAVMALSFAWSPLLSNQATLLTQNAIGVMFVLLFLDSLFRLNTRPAIPMWLPVVFGAAAIYTQAVSIVPIFAISIALLIFPIRDKPWRRQGRLNILLGLLFLVALPWFATNVGLLAVLQALQGAFLRGDYFMLHHADPLNLLRFSLSDGVHFLASLFTIHGPSALAALLGLAIVFGGLALPSRREDIAFPRAAIGASILAVFAYLPVRIAAAVGTVGGYVPMWPDLAVGAPFFFLGVGNLVNAAGSTPRRRFVAPLFVAAVIAVQLPCFYSVLTQSQKPDTKGAWEYIHRNLEDGDGVVGTPVSLFQLSSVLYYGVEHRRNDRGWTRFENKSVYLTPKEVYLPFSDFETMLFVKRFWQVVFDRRILGRYPRYSDSGNERFSEAFRHWRLEREVSLRFLTIRLWLAPPAATLQGDQLQIEAGKNEVSYIRFVSPATNEWTAERGILGETEVFAPKATGGVPSTLSLIDAQGVTTRCDVVDAATENPPAGDCTIRRFELADGWRLVLAPLAGKTYTTLSVKYH